MRTTVYFATNRQEDQQATDPGLRFTAAMAPPGEGRLRWGQAFVEDTDPDPAVLRTGRIASIEGVTGDLFPKAMQDDILGSGKNLLFFVHGFANSFADGIARAAFNREWFAAADCTVITFTWPSPGLIVDQKDVVPGAVVSLFSLLGFTLSGHLRNPLVDRYLDDQAAARNSGGDFASVLDRLAPLFREARRRGRKVFLLAHSMGHIVLQGALDSFRVSGQTPTTPYFDHAVLAAADANAALAGRSPPWLPGMSAWSHATSLYHSHADQILWLSEAVNAIPRLGEKGPPDMADAAIYPPARCRFVNCMAVAAAQPGGAIDDTHQYYRRVAQVRDDILAALGGGAAPGITALQ